MCKVCFALHFGNVLDCLAVRVEKCNLPSLTQAGSCTWHFLLSFHRVLLCGIARVSAHDCEIEFNSHTAAEGRLLSDQRGGQGGQNTEE